MLTVPMVWISVTAPGIESVLLKYPCPELSVYVKQREKSETLKREESKKK